MDASLRSAWLPSTPSPHQVSVSEVKAVAEMQFGELLAAVRKAQANVMLFLEEKEQAALSQANGIKAHLEYRSAEMEKNKQELERMAAISNTVQFLEVWGVREWRHPTDASRSTLALLGPWPSVNGTGFCSMLCTGRCGNREKQILHSAEYRRGREGGLLRAGKLEAGPGR